MQNIKCFYCEDFPDEWTPDKYLEKLIGEGKEIVSFSYNEPTGYLIVVYDDKKKDYEN